MCKPPLFHSIAGFLYFLLHRCHQKRFSPPPPYLHPERIWVIGSPEIGGGGRTTGVLALANWAVERGYPVHILCHSLNKYPEGEVSPAQPASDDALWLQSKTKARVWHTKSRPPLLLRLQKEDPKALFLCDGGWEDPRLYPCKRFCPQPKQAFSYSQLLPFGRFRSLAKSHPPAESYLQKENTPLPLRELILSELPSSFFLVSSSGAPKKILEALYKGGHPPLKHQFFRDHDPHFFKHLEKFAQENPQHPIYLTEKDLVKVPPRAAIRNRLHVIPHRIKVDFPPSDLLNWLN